MKTVYPSVYLLAHKEMNRSRQRVYSNSPLIIILFFIKFFNADENVKLALSRARVPIQLFSKGTRLLNLLKYSRISCIPNEEFIYVRMTSYTSLNCNPNIYTVKSPYGP